MRTMSTSNTLAKLYAATAVLSLFLAAASAQTTTRESIKGATTVKTENFSGVVTYVEGNTLVVSMSTGEVSIFTVPESRRFVIDGKQVALRDLKPGTSLNATVTTTTTPITERTTSSITGRVWHVSGSTVILTLPDGQNKMYRPKSDINFKIGGQNATLLDLKKGMTVTAEKIVEEPKTEIASDTTVTGTAPRAK